MKLKPQTNQEYSVSITLEELARQTCIPLSEAEEAIKELEERKLITVISHPLSVPRYIINLEEIGRQSGNRKKRGA